MTNRELSDMLHRLKVNNHKESGKAYPEHMIPKSKHTGSTANGLTKAIVDFLRFSGFQAERVNTTGLMRKINGKMVWTKGGGTKGSSDISATIFGRSIKIEIKMKDKQSDAQKKYQSDVERAGGQYWLVHNWDEFITNYNKLNQ